MAAGALGTSPPQVRPSDIALYVEKKVAEELESQLQAVSRVMKQLYEQNQKLKERVEALENSYSPERPSRAEESADRPTELPPSSRRKLFEKSAESGEN